MKLTSRQVADAAVIAEMWIRNRAHLEETPSVAYAISHEGSRVLAGAKGLADIASCRAATEHTGYRVASITKTFTATLIMQLVEGGKVRLDDPVGAYLNWIEPAVGGSGLTVRHLLTHSGSIIRDASCGWRPAQFPSREQLHEELSQRAMFAPPAVGFRYSNVAYVLLGEIVEVVSGRRFATAIDRSIVRPLGLQSSGTRLTPALRSTLATGYPRRLPGAEREGEPPGEAAAFEPAGGLISTVGDLLAYQQAHFPGDTRLLSDLSKREMQRAQWMRSEEPHSGYGWMIWTVDGIPLRGHSGGFPGFVTKIGFSADSGLAAAVLTNTIGALPGVALDVIFHTISRVRAIWDDASTSSGGQTRASLGRFAGLYRGDWGDLIIGRVNNCLYLINPGEDRPMRQPSRLQALDGGGRFLIVDHDDYGHRGEELSFELDDAGRVEGLRNGYYVMRPVPV
jgi:CubicO group peptidase (beta-lactamase class C family)